MLEPLAAIAGHAQQLQIFDRRFATHELWEDVINFHILKMDPTIPAHTRKPGNRPDSTTLCARGRY
jgi:hypothetical protein